MKSAQLTPNQWHQCYQRPISSSFSSLSRTHFLAVCLSCSISQFTQKGSTGRIFLCELWVHFPTPKTPILLLVLEELRKQMVSCSKIPTWMLYFDKHGERYWSEMTELHWSPSQRQKWEEKKRREGRHMASLPDCVRFHIWKNNPKFLCINFCL